MKVGFFTNIILYNYRLFSLPTVGRGGGRYNNNRKNSVSRAPVKRARWVHDRLYETLCQTIVVYCHDIYDKLFNNNNTIFVERRKSRSAVIIIVRGQLTKDVSSCQDDFSLCSYIVSTTVRSLSEIHPRIPRKMQLLYIVHYTTNLIYFNGDFKRTQQ